MEREYLARAMTALYRSTLRDGATPQQPAESASGIVSDKAGRQHVVLNNAHGLLAVYRIKADGTLRRLKRWPKEVEVSF